MDSLDRQLRYFLKIAELSSLSRAADTLDVSQPGLSRNLAALERHLGTPLFLRTGRGVELTHAGRKLTQAASSAYAQIDAAIAELSDEKGETHGSLRIAAVHTVNYYLTSELLTRFVSKHRRVNLSVLARSSPGVVHLVEQGQADIGFVYASAVTSEAVEETPLFVDEMCLIARVHDFADGESVDLAQSNISLIGFPKSYALRRMLKSAGLDNRVVAEAETIDAMLRLCSTGIGACILPAQIPTALLADYGLVKIPLQPPGLRRRVVAIVRHDVIPDSLARQLLAMVHA